MLLGIAYVDMKVAEQAPPARKREKRSAHDYSGRSGFPRSAAEMRGIALKPSTPMGRQPRRRADDRQPGAAARSRERIDQLGAALSRP